MKDVKLNADYLLEIAGDDREIVTCIIKDCEKDSMALLDCLKSAVESEMDLSEAGALLHKLKGSSGAVGMDSLREVVTEMEGWSECEWSGFEDWSGLSDHLAASVEAALVILAGRGN